MCRVPAETQPDDWEENPEMRFLDRRTSAAQLGTVPNEPNKK